MLAVEEEGTLQAAIYHDFSDEEFGLVREHILRVVSEAA